MIDRGEVEKAMKTLNRLFRAASLVMLAGAVGCQRQLPPDPPPNLARALEIQTALVSGTDGGTSSSSSSAPTQQPTGWATLRGVFRLEGKAPPRPVLNVNKDVGVCAPQGRKVLSESLVVADDGGIRDVVIFLSSKISDEEPWTHADAKPGKTGEVIFDQKECTFLKQVLAMQVTEKLKILNSDPVGHNTNLKPVANSAFNQTIPSNGYAFYQPQAEERRPFPVVCSIHPWMQAWIITRRNSYFAVTESDGTFEIANLPAGVDLQFSVWQAKCKSVQDVTVNGQKQKWSKGRLTLNLSPTDESQNQLDVRIDASIFQ